MASAGEYLTVDFERERGYLLQGFAGRKRSGRISMPSFYQVRLALNLVGLMALTVATGCSSKLETGYEPRPLGVSAAERKGYYASPYTAEAAAAGRTQQADDFRSMRRPGHPAQQF
jgi:hypothetical protein